MDNPFLLRPEEYKRDIDPIAHYVKQASLYISKTKGLPLEECEAKIIEMIKTNTGAFNQAKPRTIVFAERQKNGDREIKKQPILEYIKTILVNEDIVAPTLTVYCNPRVKRSFLTPIVINNKKIRSQAKKKKFELTVLKDFVNADIYGKIDTNKKIANNSHSGAMSSSSTPLYNKTGHSTLTSGCRNTSSYGNSNNEKLLTGNRHYFNLSIVLNNITFIISKLDADVFQYVVNKYNLYMPTVDDVMSVIKRSSDLYYRDTLADKIVRSYVEKLTEYELAWFTYCNDFYHLAIFNETLIKNFIKAATEMVNDDGVYTADDVHKLDENYIFLGHQICSSKVIGLGKKYEEMGEKGILNYLVPTIKNSQKVVYSLSDLLSTIFRNSVVPHNVADIPHSIRRAVLVSDTDSSIFTSQELVFWYKGGKKVFDEEGKCVHAFLVLLVSETIAHILCQMSKQFGIENENLKDIYMKNEYTFDIFVPTEVSKHYYASMSVQEGNIYDKLKREYKGVQLINGKLPKYITATAKEMMNDIMDNILSNKKLSMVKYLNQVYEIEQKIKNSILSGDTTFYKNVTVKEKTSYTADNFNAYKHYVLWEGVFAQKYGSIQPPPYESIKIPTILNNKTQIAAWLNSITDSELRIRASNWMVEHKRDSMEIIILSKDYVRSNGIPEEIKPIINVNKTIIELCHVFYMILDTIGYQIKDDFILSDFYAPGVIT